MLAETELTLSRAYEEINDLAIRLREVREANIGRVTRITDQTESFQSRIDELWSRIRWLKFSQSL